MKVLLLLGAVLLATEAGAGTTCTTRMSGSVKIETCTDSRANTFEQCRTYKSGNVRKKSCRS